MMWPGGWYGMMFLGPVMMLLFIAAVVVLAVRWLGGTGGAAPRASQSRALEILKERFARGEIDKSSRSAAARSVSRRGRTEPNRSIPVHPA
jgi:putative membrane protein